MSTPRCISTRKRHRFEATVDLVGGLKENPGVFSDGGGVRIVEACRACGARRVTETWDHAANRPLRRHKVTYR